MKPGSTTTEAPSTVGEAAECHCCPRYHEAVELEAFIGTLERLLGRRAIREYVPNQPGDVPATCASIDRLAAVTGFAPRTPLADGLARFVGWYREYYA